MDYQRVLDEIADQIRPEFGKGQVASYIPALKRVSPKKFGMAVATVDDQTFTVGDAEELFSIQSISKVFTLSMALNALGADLWRRVGREPSGDPFNSLVQLEHEKGVPRNPFINAGALVVTDCLVSTAVNAKRQIIDFVRKRSGNPDLRYDLEVARSEKAHGNLNAAMAYFLKSHDNLAADVEAVLDVYFHQCALAMSCLDLARAFLYLANEGCCPASGIKVHQARRAKRINALMMTSGLYDSVGNFAFRVGMPAKSGVGGGIAGVIPRKLSVVVWSPELDPSGNSHVGTKALELFTTKTRLSVF
ncbi:MAG: glutaminase [Alphaproteobacteria bacterium]